MNLSVKKFKPNISKSHSRIQKRDNNTISWQGCVYGKNIKAIQTFKIKHQSDSFPWENK